MKAQRRPTHARRVPRRGAQPALPSRPATPSDLEATPRPLATLATGSTSGPGLEGWLTSNWVLVVLPLLIAIVLPIPLMYVVTGASPEAAALPEDGDEGDPVVEDPPAAARDPYAGKDPARVVVDRIQDGDYVDPEDVASGRFLAAFDEQADYLDDIELNELRVVHRTRNWVLVSVPYHPVGGRSGDVELRFVNDDKSWKIDRLRVKPERSD